jgi:mRNA interferase MazF
VVASEYVPARGDVVWIDFDPQAGHEQAGRRPALVISPSAYNERARLALFCPITSRAKGYSFEVSIPAGLSVSGVVLADQIKSLDWKVRRAGFICSVSAETVGEVLEKTLTLIERTSVSKSSSNPD